MDPTEHFDVHAGQPKKPPERIPIQASLPWLGIGITVEFLVWGAMMDAWSAALSLAGLVLSAAGTFILGWSVLLTVADEVRERELFVAPRLARWLASPWIEMGRAREQLTHAAWGLGLLMAGFVFQALGVVATMGTVR